jgi:kinetochore protein Nuf2
MRGVVLTSSYHCDFRSFARSLARSVRPSNQPTTLRFHCAPSRRPSRTYRCLSSRSPSSLSPPPPAAVVVMSAATFSFPLLKLSEISSCLTELGMPLTLAQLSDPKEDELKPVFEKLLELLKGVSREELKQLDFRGMEILPYPELHEESICEMGSLKELLDLCQKTGVFDITLADVIAPEKGRVRRILSALINFAKFREDKLEHFSQFTAQAQVLLDLRVQEETNSEELEKQRTLMAEAHESIKPQIATVQVDVESLQAQLQALVTEQTTLREEMKAAKAISSELSTAISERNVEILSVQGENTKLKSQIIPEPEKLKQSLKDMTNQMQTNRADLTHQTTKLKAQQSRLIQLSKLEEKVTKRVELMRSFQNEQHALQKLRKIVAEQTTRQQEIEGQTDDLTAQEDSLKENLSAAQEKLFSLQKNFESKRLTAQSALEQVTSEKDALEKLLTSARNQQEQNENIMQIKKHQLTNLQSEHARTMGSLRGKYLTLQQAVGEYHEKLAGVMSQASMA